ncbi:MAG: hypothetical protein WCJ51_02930, partial [Candidatus Moraniibacteriota bacterium]
VVREGVEKLRDLQNSEARRWNLIEKLKANVGRQHTNYIQIATKLGGMNKKASPAEKASIQEDFKVVEEDFFESKRLVADILAEIDLDVEL